LADYDRAFGLIDGTRSDGPTDGPSGDLADGEVA
jgi:hypothetical protein